MFGLFKKKKDESVAPVAQAPETPAVSEDLAQEKRKEFLAQFPGKETDIVGVTAPGCLRYDKVEGTDLWLVSISLSAWLDEYEPGIHRELARMEAMVDQTLLDYLTQRTPSNFILSFAARPAGDGVRFLMTDLPKPGFDPELKALLEEQKKPVNLEVEGLGTFTLNRSLGWYDASVEWMGSEISLNLDQNEETLADAQETARTLMSGQEDWDARVRTFAAEQLLEQVNALLAQEDAEPFTADTLSSQFQPDSILTGPNGAFEFWFSDDDLFLAHPVHVTGTLEQGPTLAEMEG